MAYLSPQAQANVAVAVLGFLYLLPSIVLWACSLCLCRRKHDPARWSFTWLKIAYSFWIVFLVFYILDQTLLALLSDGPEYIWRHRSDLETALTALSTCESAAEHIAHLVIFLTLIHLGLGILLARTGQQARLHNIASYVALGTVAVLLVLTLAYFGIWINFIRRSVTDVDFEPSFREGVNALLPGHQLDGVLKIFEFILSTVVLAFAISVLVKMGKKYEQLKAATVFLFACAILWWIRNLYEIVSFGIFYSFDDLFSRRRVPSYLVVIKFIFSTTPTFVVLIMLFVLGKRKAGGLWSTAQHAAFVPPTAQPQQQWGQGQQYTYPPPPPGYVYASPPPAQGWQPQPMQPQYVPVQPGVYPQAVQPGQQPYVYYGQVQTAELAMTGVSSATDQPRMLQAQPTQEPADGIYHQADGRPPQEADKVLGHMPKAELASTEAKA